MITLGTTYFNNPDLLKIFVDTHICHVDHLIVVDDGSSDFAENHIKIDSKISLYRVKKDYGFNSHGCRNLIMRQTKTDWNILMDIDRIFLDPAFAFETIRTKKLNPKTLYLFEMNALTENSLHPSVNDFLIHKDHFWSAGGYDEENIGMRFGDREFRMQLENFGNEKILYGVEAKFLRLPSINLNACSEHDKKIKQKIHDLVFSRISNPNPDKPTLTFDWEQVF